jgi:hypothetical protein
VEVVPRGASSRGKRYSSMEFQTVHSVFEHEDVLVQFGLLASVPVCLCNVFAIVFTALLFRYAPLHYITLLHY